MDRVRWAEDRPWWTADVRRGREVRRGQTQVPDPADLDRKILDRCAADARRRLARSFPASRFHLPASLALLRAE